MVGARDARLNAARMVRGATLLPLLLCFACATPRPTSFLSSSSAAVAEPPVAVSLRHVDHLFAEATVGGEQVGVLNIYSEAPDYRFAIEPREGYACVDDVARAMVLLAAPATLDAARLRQLDLMTRFVVRMQADNGYFHNFIWAGGRINREYRTSRAELNWWSLRALWGLEAALRRLPADGPTAARARAAADRLVAKLEVDLPAQPADPTMTGDSTAPIWLPFGSGADAGSTAMLGLIAHYQRTGAAGTRTLIEKLGEGLMRMQAGDATRFPYGAYRSWRNVWHGWGNAQAYALLRAGALLDRPDFTASALREVDHFYPYLLEHGMLSSFSLDPKGGGEEHPGTTGGEDVKGGTDGGRGGRFDPAWGVHFPQIAYGLSPMVLAAMEAYRVTGKPHYRATARRLFAWFSGSNVAGQPLYDPVSGRVFDGIADPATVNANSGAESTVEGLLALTALNGTPLP